MSEFYRESKSKKTIEGGGGGRGIWGRGLEARVNFFYLKSKYKIIFFFFWGGGEGRGDGGGWHSDF